MKCIIAFILFFIPLIGYSEGYSRDEIVIRAEKRIWKVTDWFVRDGVYEYYKNIEDEEYVKKYIKDEFFVIGSGPVIDKYNDFYKKYITFYYYGSGGSKNKLELIYREIYEGKVYDFWGAFYFVGTDQYTSDKDGTCRFFVTVANDKKGRRTVLYESPKYFDTYKVDNNYTVRIGLKDNLKLQYMITPWLFEKCYDDPEIRDYFIIFRGGKEVRKEMNWWDHYRRDRKMRWYR